VLLEDVNKLYQSGDMVLEENLVSSYHAAMDIFLKSLDGSILRSASKIFKGMPADPSHYNVVTNSLSRDLEALFTEIGALDALVVSSFNSMLAEKDQVLQISKRVSNKLGDYLLYADPSLGVGAGFFFGDSFNSAELIEVGSSLVDSEECFLGQDEGIVLLPLDGEPDRPKIKSYIINQPSNGNAGNNFELDVLGKNEIEAIGDAEPNTWYEYERVVAYESDTPLVLDLTIVLDSISVINHIHVNPINFGTPTPVHIAKLETSKDGLEYRSIKDEVPIKDFVSEPEDNTFDLSPVTAKGAGEGFYSFLPRKVQFVHIVLEQHTPHPIQTLSGERLRYAIGIRDINILGRRFKTEGSIISAPFTTGGDVRKVALWASENPVEASELADITHSISENDGAVWRPIQPQKRSGAEIPEVVDFNTIAEGAITTESEVTTLRHKIGMSRTPESFEGNLVVKEEKITQIDVVNMPTGGEFEVNTTQRPIKETLRVILPFYGSYSCPYGRYGSTVRGLPPPMALDFLEFSVDVSPVDVMRFDLPYRDVPNLREHLRVFVNGEHIEYCPQDPEGMGLTGNHSITSYEEIGEDSKVFFLTKAGRWQLQFGYVYDNAGTLERKGFLPPGGAKIQICLDGDNPRMELTGQGYVLNLSAGSDGFKENVSLVAMDALSEAEAVDHIKVVKKAKYKVAAAIDSSYSDSVGIGDETPISEPIGNVNTAVDVTAYVASDILTEDKIGQAREAEKQTGQLPPVLLPGLDNFEIEEYNFDGTRIYSPDTIYTTKREHIDGEQELLTYDGSTGEWLEDPSTYTFDAYSGMVYLGSTPPDDRTIILRCKMIETTTVPMDKWEYYRSSVHGRINTSKIVLDPMYVKTHKRTENVDGTATPLNSVELIPTQARGHDWYKQRLVKGTVEIDSALFPDDARPTEVLYVDGDTELHGIVQVSNEAMTFTDIGGDKYTYVLKGENVIASTIGFAPVRSETSPSAPESQFTAPVTGAPSNDGEWAFNDTTNTITVYSTTGMEDHVVTYRTQDDDPGVDIAGLYSIDYENAIVHFAEAVETTGEIRFEVSNYSAFYNVADVVPDGDIKEVDEAGQTIVFSTSLGMRFLKMSSILQAQPGFIKLAYEYYKQSTESLKDLEPYFSPICKDIALKAVTADTLEEL
jgi:hypothetical protein